MAFALNCDSLFMILMTLVWRTLHTLEDVGALMMSIGPCDDLACLLTPSTPLGPGTLHFGARTLHHELDVSLGESRSPHLDDVAPLEDVEFGLMTWHLMMIVHLFGEVMEPFSLMTS
jgi:hypothetical protein